LILQTLRRADRIIALTRHTQRFLLDWVGPDSVRYVPNFIRLEDVGGVPDRSQRDGQAPRVLFVGWIVEAKGVCELLQAARHLPEAHFTLVGPQQGSFMAEIREELDSLKGHVEVLSALPREEVAELYRAADVFVLPTHREGFPNTVLEAMAAGLPVIATPVGAIPDAVRHGEEGILVPPRDAEALTEALAALVRDPERRWALGARARERAVRVFSLEVVVRQLAALYDELLGE
jgi:glycosyltransferase involved in cell wall biosynthesis